MSKDLGLKTYDLAKPAEAVKMAVAVKDYVVEQKLFSNIQGRNYAHVEGWQFAGFLCGLSARIEHVVNMAVAGEVKWSAEVGIYQAGEKVSSGFAICSSKEVKRKQADEYVILSMAQTRAIGKAYRNYIGWVMKLAGYEGTPSEEMPKADERQEKVIVMDDSPNKAAEEAIKKLHAQKTLAGLNNAWRGLTAKQRADDEVVQVAKEMRDKLS